VHADWHEGREKYERSSEPHTGFRMSVGGLRTSGDDSGTHVRWLGGPLTIGDEIRIAVVEVPPSEISPPVEERVASAVSESSERERLFYLLKKYGIPAGT
jgi:hypothetical protein